MLKFSPNFYFFKDINEDDCEELEPGSGSILSGNPGRASRNKPPDSLNLPPVGKKSKITIRFERINSNYFDTSSESGYKSKQQK